ncbi:MAG: tRNA (adenosine(37)-N6)-threonylcarbamoyltransferase complex dimerization subunit type 1 TsaB [Oscillospiraceae bacterium]|jgi:tRNA threonylcarbamoyladenosine biosynthesis protein TsaB|nr:tRNA (adenosine(37)-N6)-threonylcarbamoyltransferase complex dimerization subunit type 1 TsaB [Oscillospiraceae bacterium]
MTILALECAAKAASAAILRDGQLVSECFAASGRTHSETLLPLVDAALRAAALSVRDIDIFAVTAGPGSFTGVRIGIAAVKGLAVGSRAGEAAPNCAAVSSLEAAACNLLGLGSLVLAVMDARCAQVYAALFRVNGNEIQRLTPDAALPIAELLSTLPTDEPIVTVGDGARLLENTRPNLVTAPVHLRLPRACGVAQCAAEQNTFITAEALLPIYLRVPQAERLLNDK